MNHTFAFAILFVFILATCCSIVQAADQEDGKEEKSLCVKLISQQSGLDKKLGQFLANIDVQDYVDVAMVYQPNIMGYPTNAYIIYKCVPPEEKQDEQQEDKDVSGSAGLDSAATLLTWFVLCTLPLLFHFMRPL